ncbi:Fungal peroxidase [Mycena indigotica]|uniref:Fungal peroxidase n=1 Tax=Mycena indigotica TaxID=2126181 RepID=A0A8H6S358_9AGAR|nr:Fungal peroxidase [Mycena indigotica]KAF7291876.1 Fungal peroxidase [Mycena indigotica]
MKLTLLSSIILLPFTLALAKGGNSKLLINPPAQPSLPSISEAESAANAVGLNLTNIQGDILIGMKKKKELFFFFGIVDALAFKSNLKAHILPLVTPIPPLLPGGTSPTTALNIAFSQNGFDALNITDNLGDAPFANGQFVGASGLGDPGTVNWIPPFTGNKIHGVILLASDTIDNINNTLIDLKSGLGQSITEIYSLQGAARPPPEEGHEHFGFLDGISNPAVQGFRDPSPGQAVVSPGEILVEDSSRPPWAQDGSFLVFRQLEQLVPEFNKFLADNPIRAPALTTQQGSDLLGARMVGRWKSGAPTFLSPLVDDPVLGNDTSRNNDFTYAAPGQNQSDPTDQSHTPFSAHIRKTRPRADLGLPEKPKHHIVRGGIPYGPEQSEDEIRSNTTKTERGLAFVCYQSSIAAGFQFLQQTWANNVNFSKTDTGFDPIIGANRGAPRVVNGLDPTLPSRRFTIMTDFIVSRGGEYFFSPSLSALATTFSA